MIFENNLVEVEVIGVHKDINTGYYTHTVIMNGENEIITHNDISNKSLFETPELLVQQLLQKAVKLKNTKETPCTL